MINTLLNTLINFNLITFCDAPFSGQLGTQAPGTSAFIGMISFHYYLLVAIMIVGIAVFYILAVILYKFSVNTLVKFDYSKIIKFSHSSVLEIIWTIIPAIILVFLAVPSFNLLYSLDEIINPTFTVRVVGHQWYWSYEYADGARLRKKGNPLKSICYDSYLLTENSGLNGSTLTIEEKMEQRFRLLETDSRLVIPRRTHLRILVTSADVLHSWAIPSLGVKIDACPGRLSQISLFIKRHSFYYGQCSEICGVNHGFMPISIGTNSKKRFFHNIKTFAR